MTGTPTVPKKNLENRRICRIWLQLTFWGDAYRTIKRARQRKNTVQKCLYPRLEWIQRTLWALTCCKHCERYLGWQRRGLCHECYEDRTIRDVYPALTPLSWAASELAESRDLVVGVNGESDKLPGTPGSPDRVDELIERYDKRKELFSEADAPPKLSGLFCGADIPTTPAETGEPAGPATTPLRRRASALFREWQERRYQDLCASELSGD